MEVQLHVADTLEFCRTLPDNSVDLTFCSPPYEAARTYGIDFKLRGQDWVDWAVDRFLEHYRITKGLVAWVIEGQTRQFQWSATPALFMADLHRKGVKLRKPPVFNRVGIPGSGGPDWLRNDYEFIVCATHGKLPWSDNTALGHPPKWAPGGAMANRLANGARVNQWGHSIASGATVTDEGGVVRSKGKRPSHTLASRDQWGGTQGTTERKADGSRGKGTRPSHAYADKLHTKTKPDGTMEVQGYSAPVLANPGNVIACKVGGGLMGSKLAHENEAPFPLTLAEFFVRSFCPPGGTVYDAFSGSGTTGDAAIRHGRNFLGTDVRDSQIDLTRRRLAEVQLELQAG